jgi:hypothetical protein
MVMPNQDKTMRGTKVPSKIARGSYWDGRNRFDLLHDIELDEEPYLAANLTVKATPKKDGVTEPMGSAFASTQTRTPTSSSPLKRKRSSTFSDKSQTRNNVHMGDNVTVMCDADACNTTGLPPGQSSFTRPHFSYTTAEKARTRRKFWRCSSRYSPHTWALSCDYENVNTSHYKTTWAQYDAIIGLQRWAEKREEEEVKQAEADAMLEARDDATHMQVGV